MDKHKLKFIFIKLMYLYGAVADLLILLAYILYTITDYRIYIDIMGFPIPTIELKVILTFAFGSMMGWAILLFWGFIKPLKYKFTLLLTSLGLFFFGFISDFFIYIPYSSIYTINNALSQIPLRLLLGIAFLLAYIFGFQLKNNKSLINNKKNQYNTQTPNINHINLKKHMFIQIIFWVGISFCSITTFLAYFYFLGYDKGLVVLGFPSYSDENAVAVYQSIAIMQSWTVLLLWSFHRPYLRRSILLLTALGLILPCLIYSGTIFLIFQATPSLFTYVIFICLIIILMLAYLFARLKE